MATPILSEKRWRATIVLACAGLLLTAAQAAVIWLKGEPACINTGCRIVEEAVTLSPLYFNLAGLLFFVAVLVSAVGGPADTAKGWFLRVLLTSAFAVEGVLVGYQAFVLNTFCSYCLTVFAVIALLNVVQGARHIAASAACFAGPFLFMALLTTDVSSRNVNLDMGTYAIKRCNEPEKELYLIFSKDCPHCQKVLRALEGCTRCQFHFNPVKEIDSPVLPDLEPQKEYDPRINVATLRILGIEEIPVLIDKRAEGLLFIKGDTAIIKYIEESCFSDAPLVPVEDLIGGGDEDGVCTIEEEASCSDGS